MSSSFKFTTTAALALCGAVSASVISRDVTTGVELFAYGPGIGGLPIIYADGMHTWTPRATHLHNIWLT